jgi:DNA polymerase-4
VSSEITFDQDTRDLGLLKRHLLSQAESVGRRLRKESLKGHSVTLKIKKADFSLFTRSTTLTEATDCSKIIYGEGCRLLERLKPLPYIRLIGLGVSNLRKTLFCSEQMDLFDKQGVEKKQWSCLEKAMDSIKEKFGECSISMGEGAFVSSSKGRGENAKEG